MSDCPHGIIGFCDACFKASLLQKRERLIAELETQLAEKSRIAVELFDLNKQTQRELAEKTAALQQREEELKEASDELQAHGKCCAALEEQVKARDTENVELWSLLQAYRFGYGMPEHDAKIDAHFAGLSPNSTVREALKGEA